MNLNHYYLYDLNQVSSVSSFFLGLLSFIKMEKIIARFSKVFWGIIERLTNVCFLCLSSWELQSRLCILSVVFTINCQYPYRMERTQTTLQEMLGMRTPVYHYYVNNYLVSSFLFCLIFHIMEWWVCTWAVVLYADPILEYFKIIIRLFKWRCSGAVPSLRSSRVWSQHLFYIASPPGESDECGSHWSKLSSKGFPFLSSVLEELLTLMQLSPH